MTELHSIGFWPAANGSLLSGYIKKADIPSWCRLQIWPNKYHEKGDNRPEKVGFFVEIHKDDKKGINVKNPYTILARNRAAINKADSYTTNTIFYHFPEEEVIEAAAWAIADFIEDHGDEIRDALHYGHFDTLQQQIKIILIDELWRF